MEEKKNKIMTLLGIVAILITVIGLTYAFFAPQAGGTTSTNTTVTSNTTDLLTFSINRDISFTVTQALFAENGENQSGDATATATLTPNNKTGAATMNYYLYLNIESNPTVYSESNTNEDPELMLQVFDGNNQLVTLTGLGTQKTIKGVTGYDITGVTGLKTLLDNHAISASNNTATIENWRVVVTLINLDVNQNDNTGKTIDAEIIIQRDEMEGPSPYVYWNDNFSGVSYANSVIPTGAGLSGVYESRLELANAFSNFSSLPFYIRSEIENSSVIGHDVCFWHNNYEFCFHPNYWDTDAITTQTKLKNDLESQLNIVLDESDCESYENGANCFIGNVMCGVDSLDYIHCVSKSKACYVYPDGSAKCLDNTV